MKMLQPFPGEREHGQGYSAAADVLYGSTGHHTESGGLYGKKKQYRRSWGSLNETIIILLL